MLCHKKKPGFSPLVSFQQAWQCMFYILAGLFPLQQLHSPSLLPIKGSVGALWERYWRDKPWEISGRWFHRRTLDEKLQNGQLNFWWVMRFQQTTVARAPSCPREPAPTDKHIIWSVKKKALQFCNTCVSQITWNTNSCERENLFCNMWEFFFF